MLAAMPTYAQDDYFVDLSALNALDNENIGEEQELLFPYFEEQEIRGASPSPKEEVALPKPEPKKEIALPKPEPKTATAEDKPAEPSSQVTPNKAITEQPKLPTKPETQAQQNAPALPLPHTVSAEPKPAREVVATITIAETQPTTATKESAFDLPQATTESAKMNQPKPIAPLIEETAAEEAIGAFMFEGSSYEVTAAMKQQLDDLVKKFENPVANKILIVAYNYDKDNGFMSKHICLKRSTGIRSYLLNQGYKNFSIKIINTDNPQQRNLVEVSEII